MAPLPALAHPHVLIDAREDIVLDAEGRVVAIKHHWTFDEMFSSFAKQGLDKDGKYTRESLQPLAEVNVTSLAEYNYFTLVKVARKLVRLGKPQDYWIDHDDKTGALTLNFTMPLVEPVGGRGQPVLIQVYDPEYFVAFTLVENDPVHLSAGAPACKMDIKRPAELDDATTAQLAQVPASIRQLPPMMSGLTASLSNDITVTCP